MPGGAEVSGPERVALAEWYLHRVFRLALELQFVMIGFALVLMALRQGGRHPALTLVALAIVAVVAMWARHRLDVAYRVMRKTSPLLAGAGALAVLLILDDPRNSPLWWIGLAALVIPTITGNLRCNCACAAILTLGYAVGVVAHDHVDLAIHNPDLALKASGFSCWSLLLYGTINGSARFMMLWDLPLSDPRLPPLRVRGPAERTTSPADAPLRRRWLSKASRRDSRGDSPQPELLTRRVDRDPQRRARSRPNARQVEVIVLLSEGYKQVAIAELLGLSVRQVQRHVSSARKRFGAKTTSELVSIAVRDGDVPPPPEHTSSTEKGDPGSGKPQPP